MNEKGAKRSAQRKKDPEKASVTRWKVTPSFKKLKVTSAYTFGNASEITLQFLKIL